MNQEEFFEDKYTRIDTVIWKLAKAMEIAAGERYTDNEVLNLRKLSSELQKQVHELNAGRNIFLDNDKDQ